MGLFVDEWPTERPKTMYFCSSRPTRLASFGCTGAMICRQTSILGRGAYHHLCHDIALASVEIGIPLVNDGDVVRTDCQV